MKDQLNIKIGDYCSYVISSNNNLQLGNHSDAAINCRKAAEAACKLLIYHAFPAKVAENKISGRSLSELIFVLIKDKIAEKKAINQLETLQLIGNKAAHDNFISKEEAAHSFNALNLLSDYIFFENLKIAKPSSLRFDKGNEQTLKTETAPIVEKIILQETVIQQKIDKETEDALIEKLQKISQSESEKYKQLLAASHKEILEAQQKKENEGRLDVPSRFKGRTILIVAAILLIVLAVTFITYFSVQENSRVAESTDFSPVVRQLDTSYIAVNVLNVLQDNPNMQFGIESYLKKEINRMRSRQNVPLKITLTSFKQSSIFEKDSILNQAARLGYDVVYFGELFESVLDSNMLEITGAFSNYKDYFRTKKIKFKNLTDSVFIKEINDQANLAVMHYATQQQEKRPYSELATMLEPLICYSIENFASVKGFLANMKMGAKDFKAALAIHNQIEKIIPANMKTKFYKAVAFTELEQFDSAQVQFEKALSFDTSNVRVLLEYAYLKVKQDKKAEAKTLLAKILSIDKNNKTATQWLSNLQRNEMNDFIRNDLGIKDKTATEFLKMGNFNIALKLLNEIYLADPNYTSIYGRMAKCYYELGKKENALKFGHQAVVADSSLIENTLLYASILAQTSPHEKAKILRYFAMSLKLDTKRPELYELYSNYLLSQQEISKCVEVCELGRENFPKNVNIIYTLGNCYLIQNNYYKAKPCFEIVAAKLPDDVMAQTILASCYLNTNPTINAEVNKGYKSIQNAIAINPNLATTQLVYARYLQRLSQFAAAKEHYLKAKAIDNAIIDSNLEKLLK